jgi:hypothetical protein
MSLFLDRRPRSRRFLIWKTRIFGVAAVIALVGMSLNNPYVTGAALVLLLGGVALRFVPEPREKPPIDEPDQP